MKLREVIDTLSGAIENKRRLLEMLKPEHPNYDLAKELIMMNIDEMNDVLTDLLSVDEL